MSKPRRGTCVFKAAGRAFGINHGKMGLDYDNSAFYYFGMTMLGLYVLPSTIWAASYLFSATQRVC